MGIFCGDCTDFVEKDTQGSLEKLIIGKGPYRNFHQFMNMIGQKECFDSGKMIDDKDNGTFGDILLFVNMDVCL